MLAPAFAMAPTGWLCEKRSLPKASAEPLKTVPPNHSSRVDFIHPVKVDSRDFFMGLYLLGSI